MNKNIVRDIASFESDFLFFHAHIASLVKNYPNKFVAIKGGDIIDSAPTIEKLKPKLEKKKIDISKTVVEFVPTKEMVMVL